jgi:hypothetical protein
MMIIVHISEPHIRARGIWSTEPYCCRRGISLYTQQILEPLIHAQGIWGPEPCCRMGGISISHVHRRVSIHIDEPNSSTRGICRAEPNSRGGGITILQPLLLLCEPPVTVRGIWSTEPSCHSGGITCPIFVVFNLASQFMFCQVLMRGILAIPEPHFTSITFPIINFHHIQNPPGASLTSAISNSFPKF